MLCFSFRVHEDEENPNKSLLQDRQKPPVPQANQQLDLTLAAPDGFQPQLLHQFRPAVTPPGPALQPGPVAEEELREAKRQSPTWVHSQSGLGLAIYPAYHRTCRLLCFAQGFTGFFSSAEPVIPRYRKGWTYLLSITVTGPFCLRCLGIKYRLQSTSQRADLAKTKRCLKLLCCGLENG